MNFLSRSVTGPLRTWSSLRQTRLSISSTSARPGTFEPDYLDSSGPVIPVYPPINIQIKGKSISSNFIVNGILSEGYNFDILESFQSYIHNLAENMGINVEGAWATPARTYQATTFK